MKSRKSIAIMEALIVLILVFPVSYLSSSLIGRPYSLVVSMTIGMIMGMIWVMRNGYGSERRR